MLFCGEQCFTWNSAVRDGAARRDTALYSVGQTGEEGEMSAVRARFYRGVHRIMRNAE